VLLCACALGTGRAAAAEAPGAALPKRRFSALEEERIRRALVRQGGTADPTPDGKRIESIEIVALDVFEPEDAVPQFLNWFHVTTKRHVIEREVLLHVGAKYGQRLSDETERNLRNLGLFSVVVAVPMLGSRPDTVRYLLVTKDIWSLRVGWDGRINKGVIDYLSMQPSERNLFGSGRRVLTNLVFGPRTFSVGAGFVEPRLADSHIELSASVAASLSCQTGELEGTSGSFQYFRPLYSSLAHWSYATSVGWSNGRAPFTTIGNAIGAICSVRSREEATVEVGEERLAVIPNRYQFDSQSFSQSFTRSYGERFKTNLSFGLEAARVAYGGVELSNIRAPDPEGPELTPFERQIAELRYQNRLFQSSRRISPFFQIQSFTTNYHRDLNAETLALQEDSLLGHVASLRVYPALRALASSRNLLGLQAFVSYARSVGTGYLKGSATHTIQLSSPDQSDGVLSLALRFNSPRFALGRFVYDARFVDHHINYRNTAPYVLGGTGRLRGYTDVAVAGQHLLTSNLEFRTRPIQLFSVQLAAALFHDMGTAFDKFGSVRLLHGLGAGIRFLAPQLDRDVFRVDVGFPVPSDAPGGELSVIATFGQAFGPP
jgi:outer membrane protein assembly factor BamA